MMMRRSFAALLLLLGAAGVSRAAAQRAHFGFHGAYNTEMNRGALGAQVQMPIASRLEFYPSFDYYFVDTGNELGLNADLKYRAAPPLYFGGGLNILSGGGTSDAGADLIGGFETRAGQAHPYAEARALLHGSTSWQFLFGLNFTLY